MTELERAVGVEREAPTDLLHRLRVIDPTAELVYMGRGVWWLGRVVPNRVLRSAGDRKVGAVAQVTRRRRPTAQEHRAHLVGRLQQHGFQFTAEYAVNDPDGAILTDQQVMDFLYRTLTDGERDVLADRDEVRRRAEAHAELTDDARATDAWRYLFTRSHAVTRPSVRALRSGRTLLRSVS